jgi:hypothetical protein
MEYGTFMN